MKNMIIIILTMSLLGCSISAFTRRTLFIPATRKPNLPDALKQKDVTDSKSTIASPTAPSIPERSEYHVAPPESTSSSEESFIEEHTPSRSIATPI
jgi:hypothetical protein